MKLIPRQKIWLAVVILANVLLWVIPSDVVEMIARDRQTMLGRYSRTHFYWIVAVAIISIISFYVDWSTGATYRKRWFQLVAALSVLIPTLFVVDFLMRKPGAEHYVRDTVAYHRPPGFSIEMQCADKPEAYRSFPGRPEGHPTFTCGMRTDERGYRNPTALDQADVVVLGDSFAEGSHVSDEHAWPAILADASGLSVYNLGMSGYEPLEYAASLEQVGLALKPKFVFCQIYEGNDFRSAKADRKRLTPSLSKRLELYFDQSPIIQGLDRMLIDTFGPINATGPVNGGDLLDWLPIRVPAGPEGKPYAFAPKQLRDLYVNREDFAKDRHWFATRAHLESIRTSCVDAGCQLVVMYAPTKAHVTLPAVADRLPAPKVRDYTQISYDRELPAPDAFLAKLVEYSDGCEAVVRAWCEKNEVAFLSTTGPLRQAALAGTQVYFTYDQHWSPDGHRVVADTVHAYLRKGTPRTQTASMGQ